MEQVFFPLDEQLKLQPGGLTPLQLAHLVHYATLQSFDKAARMLLQHHGVHVSASTSRRQTEGIGVSAELVQNEQGKAQLLRKSSDSERGGKKKKPVKLVISNDGAHISLRGNVWAEVKTMAVGEIQEKTHPSKQRPKKASENGQYFLFFAHDRFRNIYRADTRRA